MDFDRIQRLIDMVEASNISGLKVEDKGLKVEIQKQAESAVVSVPAPVAEPVPVAAVPEETKAEEDAGLVSVKSPMVGTFYVASGPEASPYVQVGKAVQKGDVLCVVEAMKLFNEIESELSGTVEKVLVENASPVEYGQDLFLIRVS